MTHDTAAAGPIRVARLALLVACTAALPVPLPARAAPPGGAGAEPRPPEHVHYRARVKLDPGAHRIEALVEVALPPGILAGVVEPRFLLHGGLDVRSPDAARTIEEIPGTPDASRFGINEEGGGAPEVPLRAWRVKGLGPADAEGVRRFRVQYQGAIHHPVKEEAEEYARSFARTPGIIGPEGVVLSGSSWWLPRLGDMLTSFRLDLELPEGWKSVSQGRRERRNGLESWDSPEPMDEVYLVAAPFVEYERAVGPVLAQAFLRQDDPNLAARYLEATVQDIAMYERLLGPYPFAKFALVENFWETGYGMPSFTLLGPKVIRFPFLLTSSYPHEILHNWWGNSVFVDYQSGNWCEGLTAYLADHLFKEGQGEGEAYRRDTLKRYSDHVRGERDFPLTEFRSRHSSATEAVGYGKSLMLWHMLRLRLGDRRFVQALQRFYREERFQKASFADIERVLSAVAGEDLKPLFTQWVTRAGAPELRLDPEATRHTGAGADGRLEVVVRQVQGGAPFVVDVPVAVTVRGEPTARILKLPLTGASGNLTVPLAEPPVAVAVDPRFDIFRRLDLSEIPPTLSELYGAEKVTLVLPGEQTALPAAAWKPLTEAWADPGSVEVVTEEALEALPGDRAVWLLGSDNRRAIELFAKALAARGAGAQGDSLAFGPGAEPLPRAGASFAYALRSPSNPDLAIGWIGATREASIPGLARKLPHYGKYSFLAFTGDEPTNVRKGQWEVLDSPLVKRFGDGSPGKLPPREPLARPEPVFDPAALLAHVRFLSGPELEGRGAGTAGLDRAAEYIAGELKKAGLAPAGDGGGWFQTWTEPGGPAGKDVTLRNVVGVLRGTKAEWASQSVVLGAHYDHLGRGWPDQRKAEAGRIYPGADDNASGVAVLLEVARLLAASLKPERSLLFVAFAGEEWGLKGSRRFLMSPGGWMASDMRAMVNLDTVGRLGGQEITVLGAGSASEWVHIARGIGFTTGIKSKTLLDDPGGSDQKSFLEAGIPAIQLFTGAHQDYHRPGDTADKVDAAGLAKVASFARETLVYLSERPEPLTSNLAAGAAGAAPTPGASPDDAPGGRRVTLGTMPDFEFPGPGVRVAKVMAGTPAETAGLKEGDVLLALDGEEIPDLRTYSALLKKHAPGDKVSLRVQRRNLELTLEAKLVER